MRRASFHLTQLTRRASLTSRTFLSANTSTDNFPRNKPLRAYSSSPPTNSSAPQTNPTKLSADKPSPEEQHAALLEAASQLPVPAYSFSTTPVNTGNPIPDALTDPHTNNIDIPAAPEALDMSTADADADDAYMAFLNKANEKPAPSAASTTSTQQQHGTFKPSDAAVPRALDAAALADRFYVSEADEPFEPVSYTWNGGARDLDIGTSVPISPHCVPLGGLFGLTRLSVSL